MSMFKTIFLFVGVIAAVASGQPLPLLQINPNTVTISGISAGGAFAVQVEFALSSLVKAAGIVAGVPYQCSLGTLAGAVSCMDDIPLWINVPYLITQAEVLASLDFIDDVSNIANHTVFLFSGLIDTVVNHGTMIGVQSMYELLGVPENKLTAYFNYTAEHAWITNEYGNACELFESPYINNCGLDFAGNFLQAAMTNMNVKWNTTRGTFNPNNLMTFSQATYGADVLLNSMGDHGYVYIPDRCKGGNNSSSSMDCHLHISFHGCDQSTAEVGSIFAENAGINEWAETNGIVVLYPQAAPNALLLNPNACFDWWGYTDEEFATKDGAQISIVRAMIQALAGF